MCDNGIVVVFFESLKIYTDKIKNKKKHHMGLTLKKKKSSGASMW